MRQGSRPRASSAARARGVGARPPRLLSGLPLSPRPPSRSPRPPVSEAALGSRVGPDVTADPWLNLTRAGGPAQHVDGLPLAPWDPTP